MVCCFCALDSDIARLASEKHGNVSAYRDRCSIAPRVIACAKPVVLALGVAARGFAGTRRFGGRANYDRCSERFLARIFTRGDSIAEQIVDHNLCGALVGECYSRRNNCSRCIDFLSQSKSPTDDTRQMKAMKSPIEIRGNKRRSRRRLLAFALISLIVIVAAAYLSWTRAPSWSSVDQWIALRYTDVDSISTAELATLLDQKPSSAIARRIVLLDIREANEFAVSRIPNARHVAPSTVNDYARRELANIDRAQLIVVYCAVGVRSAQAARNLKAIGFTNVRNLRGSIFQWANESRVLEGAAQRVHPFDSHWGRLLREDLRSPVSSRYAPEGNALASPAATLP
jgi:rhodanese-related sulfurtransferase